MATTVPCPTCQTQVVWSTQSPHRPFCSDRCRLIDLGQWANEEHKIAAKSPDHELDKNDVDHMDIEDIEALLANQKDEFFK